MRTRVVVKLVAEEEVEIDVEHEADESPTDLTAAEEAEAISKVRGAVWVVDRVRVAGK